MKLTGITSNKTQCINWSSDEPLLDTEAEKEYEDQYTATGQANEDETLRLKDETSKSLWH